MWTYWNRCMPTHLEKPELWNLWTNKSPLGSHQRYERCDGSFWRQNWKSLNQIKKIQNEQTECSKLKHNKKSQYKARKIKSQKQVEFAINQKYGTKMPNMMRNWIPSKCTWTRCIKLFRTVCSSFYSIEHWLGQRRDIFIRCLDNAADHCRNVGICRNGLNTIDSSSLISYHFCLRNYTHWRQIRMQQWLHAPDRPVQFTWPKTCEAWSSWVSVNVRYICLMWE